MVQLKIIKTAKGYSPKSQWERFDEDLKTFNSIEEAKAWIKETYGKSKKMPMFIDDENFLSHQVGYIIGFKNADWGHSPVNKWLQQDWIEFRDVHPLYID